MHVSPFASLAFATAAFAAFAGACSETEPDPGPAPYDGPPIPWEYEAFPTVVDPADNPSSPEKVELGRLLFYDPILSRDQATACATCHSEQWGMSDGLPRSIGVDGEGPTGPGRTGDNMLPRNAQSLWNAAFRPELFWDGRSDSLEAQVLEPLKAHAELDLDPDEAAARIADVDEYVDMFRAAFPDEATPVTKENFARAIAAFERTMLTNGAPYDHYLTGDEGSLSDESIEGMQAFADLGCASCHVPPLFESNRYEHRFDAELDDDGRMKVTKQDADRAKFRVPTLRNLRETGPYFHDGHVKDLEEAVALEAGRPVDDADVVAIPTFLRKALMDRSKEPTRPDEVPSGLPVPEDGLRIPR